MIYHITHKTSYRYHDAVSVSHHVLRLRPRTLSSQACLSHRVEITPNATSKGIHSDYYGNEVMVIAIEDPHALLTVVAHSEVEVWERTLPEPDETLPWEMVRDARDEDQEIIEAGEFRYDSPMIRLNAEYARYAQRCFTPGRPIMAAVLDLTRRIYKEFKFDPKATTVATPLDDVFRLRRGVCQDFAHFQIACLRSLGLAARYVSGYLETDPPPGQARLAGADASHAWASFHCPGYGWIDVDPTNNVIPGLRHVTMAWGRDFSDVSPIRGVILGSGDHTLSVAVDVIPETEKAG